MSRRYADRTITYAVLAVDVSYGYMLFKRDFLEEEREDNTWVACVFSTCKRKLGLKSLVGWKKYVGKAPRWPVAKAKG